MSPHDASGLRGAMIETSASPVAGQLADELERQGRELLAMAAL
jgi:hypothetical protein